MYATLGVIFILGVWTLSALSQQSATPVPFDRMKRRMELREEMHRRIIDKLVNGVGSDQDLFKDLKKNFEDSMPDSSSRPPPSSNFSSEWAESKNGRTLIITPKNPEQKINVDVNATQITIKGEELHQTPNSTYSSSFSNSFSIPNDCDGTRVKMDSKEGKLLVELPYKSNKAIQPKSPKVHIDGEVQI